MQSADDGARRGAKQLERDGCRNWHWRCVLQRSRLRRLAWTGAQADIDWRPHDPRQDIEARQSLPARPVRAGGLGRADQAKELGTLRAQALDRAIRGNAGRFCENAGKGLSRPGEKMRSSKRLAEGLPTRVSRETFNASREHRDSCVGAKSVKAGRPKERSHVCSERLRLDS